MLGGSYFVFFLNKEFMLVELFLFLILSKNENFFRAWPPVPATGGLFLFSRFALGCKSTRAASCDDLLWKIANTLVTSRTVTNSMIVAFRSVQCNVALSHDVNKLFNLRRPWCTKETGSNCFVTLTRSLATTSTWDNMLGNNWAVRYERIASGGT